MCEFGKASDLLSLNNLLNPSNETSDDDELDTGIASSYTPGVIGSQKKNKSGKVKPSPYDKLGNENGKSIWSSHEIAQSYDDKDDDKITPEYDIKYKQKVTSGDLFLGINGKSPASSCCEDLLISIKLPDAAFKDIDLQINKNDIIMTHSVYHLNLPLPHPVDPKQGKAEWDSSKEELRITLRMSREYDFLNF